MSKTWTSWVVHKTTAIAKDGTIRQTKAIKRIWLPSGFFAFDASVIEAKKEIARLHGGNLLGVDTELQRRGADFVAGPRPEDVDL